MMLILHPRIGGKPTAAVIANGGWGLIGFGIAIAVLQAAAPRFGSAIALSLALATCIGWNLGLWWERAKEACAVSKPSFRSDAKHRTRNLEIPGLVLRTIPE